MDGLATGRLAATFDLVAQRFRAIEAACTAEGGWAWAQHLKVLPANEAPRRHAGGNGPRGKEGGCAVTKKRRPREFGKGIEDQRYPDPENNATGAGGRGAPPRAIVNSEEKGKGQGKRKGKSAK